MGGSWTRLEAARCSELARAGAKLASCDAEPKSWLDVACGSLWDHVVLIHRVEVVRLRLALSISDSLMGPADEMSQIWDGEGRAGGGTWDVLSGAEVTGEGGIRGELVCTGTMRLGGSTISSEVACLVHTWMLVAAMACVESVIGLREHRVGLLETLTKAQRKVVPGFAEGSNEKEIATTLARSQHTVHDHIRSLYSAWRVQNKTEARQLWHGVGRPIARLGAGGVELRPTRVTLNRRAEGLRDDEDPGGRDARVRVRSRERKSMGKRSA